MKHCQLCNIDVTPTLGIEGGAVVEYCPRCQGCIGKRDRSGEPVADVPTAADAAIGLVATVRPQRTAAPKPAKPAFSAPAQQPGDIVAMANARLAIIDIEIARLEGLKTERKQLAAMVRAAGAHTKRVDEPRLAKAVGDSQ